jgi:hypothetical protein
MFLGSVYCCSSFCKKFYYVIPHGGILFVIKHSAYFEQIPPGQDDMLLEGEASPQTNEEEFSQRIETTQRIKNYIRCVVSIRWEKLACKGFRRSKMSKLQTPA